MASIFRERDMRSNYPESNCEMNFRLNQPSYLLWRHWIHKHTERSVSSFSRFPLVRFINVIIKFLLSIFDAPALLFFSSSSSNSITALQFRFPLIGFKGAAHHESALKLLSSSPIFFLLEIFFVRVRQRWAAQRHLNFFFNIFYCWLLAKEWTKPPQALAR